MSSCEQFNQKITDFFKAMGNEKRQEIILNVFGDRKEHNVTETANKVKIAQSTVSEHLLLLKRAGILISRKDKKEVFYKLDKQQIISTLDTIKSIVSNSNE
jgi:tellurite resistance protein TerB